MVGIQLFATPAAKAAIFNGMVSTTYHVANLYRGRERYKVWLSIGLEGARWRVTGSDKKTGFEPFCQKWAKRFEEFSTLVSGGYSCLVCWGYSWNGSKSTNSIEELMCKYCDKLQVVTCYPKQEYLKTLMSLHRSHGKSSYSSDYIKLKKSARKGWTKTINVK